MIASSSQCDGFCLRAVEVFQTVPGSEGRVWTRQGAWLAVSNAGANLAVDRPLDLAGGGTTYSMAMVIVVVGDYGCFGQFLHWFLLFSPVVPICSSLFFFSLSLSLPASFF